MLPPAGPGGSWVVTLNLIILNPTVQKLELSEMSEAQPVSSVVDLFHSMAQEAAAQEQERDERFARRLTELLGRESATAGQSQR